MELVKKMGDEAAVPHHPILLLSRRLHHPSWVYTSFPEVLSCNRDYYSGVDYVISVEYVDTSKRVTGNGYPIVNLLYL